MKKFFGEDLFLDNKSAKKIYNEVKNLPIIDYHCHLDQNKIKEDYGFSDIGELWLAGDHYKWRAMRLCGVDEYYITGKATFKEKFIKYAEILPKMAGNALYYWTHMELKQIFNVDKPLNKNTAEEIYEKANAILKNVSVSKLLEKFKVEYIATTDDPIDDLSAHGVYGKTKVAPTFRPDKLLTFDKEYLNKLSEVSGEKLDSLSSLKTALIKRLDYFVEKGSKITDHGFEKFSKTYIDENTAEKLYSKLDKLTDEEKDALKGYLLIFLAKEYKKRNMIMQIHFAVIRNNNPYMFKQCGVDSGFDLVGEEQSVKDVVNFFAQISDEERPETVLYTLNDNNLSAIADITGAFRSVRMGAAWWFNDTVEGIRKNLSVIAEYSSLGENLGMLTDSRSFSSYVRFDFFRRLLAGYLGNLVEKGEYDLTSALAIAKDICYNNVKGLL